MRIIAGRLKGRRLASPSWSGLRPTSDRARETLFNILGDELVGGRVLDACAGTGAIGIEAVSRGATSVVCVERDRRASALIRRNLTHCGITEEVAIVHGALPRAAGCAALREPFDVIFVDPPYDDREVDKILSAVAGRLAPRGRLVLERSKRAARCDVDGLCIERTVTVGDSELDFYEHAVIASPVKG